MGSAGALPRPPGHCAAMGGRDSGGSVPVGKWSQQQEAGYGDSKSCLWAKQASTINITTKKKKKKARRGEVFGDPFCFQEVPWQGGTCLTLPPGPEDSTRPVPLHQHPSDPGATQGRGAGRVKRRQGTMPPGCVTAAFAPVGGWQKEAAHS